MDDVFQTLRVSAAGLKTQGTRLRVIAENVANAGSMATAPGEVPYRRKTVTFRNVLDRDLGVETVRVHRIADDPSPFARRFDPSHPAADGDGYVLASNVNGLIEMGDMREAQRSYEANLNVIKASKAMLTETIEILR
ncbi:MAG: flagellar basal body rod protein FlgC [Rhodospirillales bacterium]